MAKRKKKVRIGVTVVEEMMKMARGESHLTISELRMLEENIGKLTPGVQALERRYRRHVRRDRCGFCPKRRLGLRRAMRMASEQSPSLVLRSKEFVKSLEKACKDFRAGRGVGVPAGKRPPRPKKRR